MIVTPMEFDAMPNGSIVSGDIAYQVFYNCSLSAGEEIGIRLDQAYGLGLVGGGVGSFNYLDYKDIYTVPELESRGLGISVKEGSSGGVGYFYSCISGNRSGVRWLWQTSNAGQLKDIIGMQEPKSIVVSNCGLYPVSSYYLEVGLTVRLVKIGNSVGQHEALPQNFTVPLIGLVYYYTSNPSIQIGSVTLSLNAVGFASRVVTRTCATPTASESIINFGSVNQQQVQTTGIFQAVVQREFTLTFNCPYAPYGRFGISFFVEPMYGLVNNRIMRIAQGTGMAQGVGIRLRAITYNGSAYEHDVVYREDPLDNTGCRHFSCGKIVLSEWLWDGQGSPPMSGQLVVSFKASLIRLNEPVVAGQIKAAALIHIRYN